MTLRKAPMSFLERLAQRAPKTHDFKPKTHRRIFAGVILFFCLSCYAQELFCFHGPKV
jgi:hypothetical protein